MFKKIFTAGAFAMGLAASSAVADVIDLGFAIDESGSVSGSATTGELGIIRQGLANALDLIPSVGATGNPNTYTVTIVRFASSASVLVSKTVINDANRAAIQNTLLTAGRISGGTNINAAVSALTSAVCGIGTDTCSADTTLFNVATDGSGSSPVTGGANAEAMTAGVDGISYETIGGGVSPQFLVDNNWAYPTTPVLVTDPANLPDPTTTGFVLAVDSFDDFEDAIASKVTNVVDSTGGGGPSVVPLPAGMPLILSGFAVLGLVRSRRKAS